MQTANDKPSLPGLIDMDAATNSFNQLVADRVGKIRQLIDTHATRPCKLVAVTKRFGPTACAAAMAAGVDDLGENYAQELAQKAGEVSALACGEPTWHFIGHLQRNKVKLIAPHVTLWQTVDSERLGTEIAKRQPGARVLIQLNTSGAETQSGLDIEAAPQLVDVLRSTGLDVAGFMTIGTMGDIDASATQFREVRRLADDLGMNECSMGMSADMVEALKAGSTMVRVGTAIFGARPDNAR